MEIADTLHKTLFIRFSSVGDIVLSSLLLRAFRNRFPSCRTDFLVKSEYADLVRFSPYVSTVMEFPGDGGFRDVWRLRQMIRNERYDLVVDIHNSTRSRIASLGLRRVVRVNKRKLARFLLVNTKWNLYGRLGGALGIAERYLEPVRFLGVMNDGKGLEMFLPPRAGEESRDLLKREGVAAGELLIGVAPAARHINKMWPAERFAESVSALAREKKASVLLFGFGREENLLCAGVQRTIGQKSPGTRVVNFADRLSIPLTVAMMDLCSVVLTNDSGLMHLAAARKRKVVAVFGPTVKELGFFPYGTEARVLEDTTVPCRPCTHIGLERCPKGHFHCMMNISPDKVTSAARDLLSATPVS